MPFAQDQIVSIDKLFFFIFFKDVFTVISECLFSVRSMTNKIP